MSSPSLHAPGPVSVAPVTDGDGLSTPRRPLARHERLAARVFALNAAVVVLSCTVTVLVFTHGDVSSAFAVTELAVVATALVIMLALNRLLLAGAFAPLERVMAAMWRADPLAPGDRVPVPRRPSEAGEMAIAFNEMASRLEDERRGSARRVLGAQEEERARIARELHDEVGQQLTALLLQLASARRVAGDGPLQGPLGEAHLLTRSTLEDIRRVARELRPEALDDLGLASALAALCERLAQSAGLHVDLELHQLPELEDDEELVVYRVAQEALTNVIRHAGTGEAELSLRADGGIAALEVRDRGRGFTSGGVGANGLVGMRERALLVGAELDIDSAPGRGTTVRLLVTPRPVSTR